MAWGVSKATNSRKGRLIIAATAGIVLLVVGVAATIFFGIALSQAQTQYGIMMDAGSSGTRVYVYSWDRHGDKVPQPYPDEDSYFLRVFPGISTLSNASDDGVARYLEPLLSFAASVVPQSARSCTPVYLRATAGMRLLPTNQTDAIMSRVARALAASPFESKTSWSSVIGGQDEAMYAWVAVNAALGQLRPDVSPIDTIGAVELGGASAQIAFVSNLSVPAAYQSNVSVSVSHGLKYEVYTASFLTWGLTQATLRLESALPRDDIDGTRVNPCLPSGSRKYDDMVGGSNFTLCYAAARRLLLQNASSCPFPRCSIDGAFQPPLRGSFYALDNYVDVVASLGLPQTATLSAVIDAAEQLCSLNNTAYVDRYSGPGNTSKCFAAAYTVAMLHDGFGFDLDARSIEYAPTIDGHVVTWSFGAMLLEASAYDSCSSHGWADDRKLFAALLAVGCAMIVAALAIFAAASFFMCCRRRRTRASSSSYETIA